MNQNYYRLIGICVSLLMAGWAFSRYGLLIVVIFIVPPVLLTGGFWHSRNLTARGSYRGAYFGALFGCLLLPLLDLLKPFYSEATWYGPIAIGFSVIVWPLVICIAGTAGMGIGYMFSKLNNET